MKSCAYCGRENLDDATHCRECGTDEFVAAIPPTTKDITSEAVGAAADAPVELQRCRDSEGLAMITQILDSVGITYRVSSLTPMFDIGKIGAGEDAQVIVSVPRNLFDAARAAMESENLKIEVPENHHLLTSTDEELVEIVAKASEWSAFDMAHAKRLIDQRGIDLKKIEDKRAEHLGQLQRGQRASKTLIFFGWVFSVLGGLIGVGIACSLAYMKEKTPQGDFFTYDEASRAVGRKMLVVAGTVIAIAVVLRLALLLSR
jgi:hypothetical protein